MVHGIHKSGSILARHAQDESSSISSSLRSLDDGWSTNVGGTGSKHMHSKKAEERNGRTYKAKEQKALLSYENGSSHPCGTGKVG